ncbi:unnamed protein product [Linum trigynum]|uniref:RNase H type-1 domain-containing protein n=1 Tax=Linum trigynum TaxID=586398 RepID=A0AAV2DYU0_9ROSI
MADFWGIHQGLLLSLQDGVEFLILESDSQLGLNLIQKHTDTVHSYVTILGLIRCLLGQRWVVHMVHTYKEGNRVAKKLSKHNFVYHFGTPELEEPPMNQKRMLEEDIIGVSFPRQTLIRLQHDCLGRRLVLR